MVKKVYDKIYWYRLDMVEKTNIIINRIEKVEAGVLCPDRPCYKVYYNINDDGKVKESWIRVGAEGTGIKLGKFRRYMVDRSGKLDIIGVKKYLHNREISEVLENI